MPPRRRVSSQNDTERPHPWLSMSLYWLFSAAVALKTGYFSILFNRKEALSSSSLPSAKLLFASLLATLAPQPFYFRAVSERAAATRPGGRDWGAIAVFAVVNSLLETAVFKATVDLGAAAAAAGAASGRLSSFPLSSSPSLASFLLLSAYCGLVHALFWDKCAFPPHRPPFLAAKAKAEAEAATATATGERATRSTRRARAAAATATAEEEGGGGGERARAAIGRQRSAMNGALLLFFPMTAAWHRLLLLASSGSGSGSGSGGDSKSSAAALAAVVALHAVADFAAAFSLRLRGPFGSPT